VTNVRLASEALFLVHPVLYAAVPLTITLLDTAQCLLDASRDQTSSLFTGNILFLAVTARILALPLVIFLNVPMCGNVMHRTVHAGPSVVLYGCVSLEEAAWEQDAVGSTW
jgi:hypothetical protein